MGAFIVNFHVQTESVDQVTESLRRVPLEYAWITEPQGGWVSFWEQQASTQDSDRIRFIAEHVSRDLDAPVISFLVHDSDILCYWLYDSGKLLDEYNSCPGYWGDDELVMTEAGSIEREEYEPVDELSLAANYDVLMKYCRPGTDRGELERILAQWTQAEVKAGIMPAFVFVEERLSRLAPLMGLSDEIVITDYGDIGDDVAPDELGATWIGTAERPASNMDDEQDSRT